MLLVKPSRKSIKTISEKIATIVRKAQAWTQDRLILALNPVIRGWSNYHRHNAAKRAFGLLDRYVWAVTWKWGKHRHPNKGHKWIARRYWHREGNRNWVFRTEENTLQLFGDVTIRRHTIPRLNANPYLDRIYFLERRERMKRQTPGVQPNRSFFALPPENRVVGRMSVLR